MDLRQTSSLRRFGSQPGGHKLILKHRNGQIFAVRVPGRHLVAYIADIYCLYLVDFQQPRYMIQRPRRLSTESMMKVQQRSSTMLTRPSRTYFHPFKRELLPFIFLSLWTYNYNPRSNATSRYLINLKLISNLRLPLPVKSRCLQTHSFLSVTMFNNTFSSLLWAD
ncbi:hypothetical protein C8J57DRAFT_215064 [Mycena rebaudengoi]|nr:hypothetical protein C8J57DRAFT_215064 [Mycena rebaudengoi]